MNIGVTSTISVALLVYYVYMYILSDFIRRGMVHNTPNLAVARLRTKYKVAIKTFQRNDGLNGFAWFNTIYLNENLLNKRSLNSKDPNYALKWTFLHELYHLKNKHKQKVLIWRFLFSLIPMVASIPLPDVSGMTSHFQILMTALLFSWSAYQLNLMRERQEAGANEYANQKIKE